jgi:hypothetical protein
MRGRGESGEQQGESTVASDPDVDGVGPCGGHRIGVGGAFWGLGDWNSSVSGLQRLIGGVGGSCASGAGLRRARGAARGCGGRDR